MKLQVYALSVLVFLIVVVMTAVFWDYTQDDVFITFVYSRNIADGVGFVFNPGQQVQGTTTPLWALLTAGTYLVTTDLLHAGNIYGGVFLLISCALAFRLMRPYLSKYGLWTTCLLLATSPLIYASYGMETLLYCALLMLSFWLWSEKRYYPALLAAAALTWTRADGVVLAGMFGLLMLWDTWRGNLPLPTTLRAGIVYALGIAPWFLFAWIYFGTPLPNTLGAKQAILNGILFWTDGVHRWQGFYGNNPVSLLALIFIPIGGYRALLVSKTRPLALWATFYTLGYTALNITNFWYYTPLIVISILLAVMGAEQTMRWIRQRSAATAPLLRYVALGLVIISSLLGVAKGIELGPPPNRMNTYRVVGEWIEANTPSDATVVVGDLGIVGFYAHRDIIDVPGLITPDMHFKSVDYATLKYKYDYIVGTQYYDWSEATKQAWFADYYIPRVQLSTTDDFGFSPMTVYQRRLETTVPSQAIQGFDLPLTCMMQLDKDTVLPEETFARLASTDGLVIVETSQPFLEGAYPETTTPTAETILEQIALPLYIEPGEYRWELECDVPHSGSIEVLPISQAEGYVPVNAEWEDFGTLKGVVISPPVTVWSGGTLELALHYETTAAIETDYSVFVHLIDTSSDGDPVAQADGSPLEGTRPTSSWQPGETLVDVRHVMLPPDLPSGSYSLVVGWYDWQTNERLSTIDGHDSVILPLTIKVKFPGGSGLP